jgi:hypothetical protein
MPMQRSVPRLRFGLAAALVAATAVGGVVTARAAWVDRNCSGGSYDLLNWKRSQASTYFEPMNHEGYEWGGGCFKLNDRDDTPAAPDSGGEGTDCSGLVFRTWALKNDGTKGYHYWDYEKNIHGPYTTANYYAPTGSEPFRPIGKSYDVAQALDAFVYRNAGNTAGHIGLIYQEAGGGTDYIAESAGDAEGTWIQLRDYRSQSSYRAVQRKDWTPECFPRCDPAAVQAEPR